MIFTPDTYRKFLELCDRFHNYSYKNVMLIFSQNPDATKIAGGKAWKQQFNRNLIPGAKGIGILIPLMSKDYLEFRSVSVYDVSQTEGAALSPSLDYDYKTLISCIREISDASLVFGDASHSKCLSVKEDMTDEKMVEALFSELAGDDVSYILCKHFGLKTSTYRFEITELDDATLKGIHTAASDLIRKIEWSYQNRLGIKNLSYFTFEEMMALNYCLEEDDRYEFIQKMVRLHDNSESEDIRDIVWSLISKIELISDTQYEKLKEDKFSYKLSAFSNYTIE